MTYRDPNEPLGAEAPTEAYRAPAGPAIEPFENGAPVPAPTSPAVPPTAGRRPSRLRWAVAIAVVALVVAASGVAAVLLTGSAPAAKVLGWVPADSVVYGEFRLDLPGDQRQNLAEFLSHFPGFDDQAAIDTKLDETLDRFLTTATEGAQSYISDVEPWFEGEIAVVLGALPDASAMSDPEAMEAPDGVVLLSVKDATLARAWFDAATQDAAPTTEEYEGVTVTLLSPPEGSLDGTMAYAVTDEVAVLGEVGAVKDVLDTKGNGGIADDPEFAAALDSGSGDHIGFLYYDMAAYWDWAMELSAESDLPTMAVAESMRDQLPAWAALWLRIEGDALSFQAATPAPEERTGTTENRSSTLTKRAPATSIMYAETHDYGTAISDMLALYADFPIPESAAAQLEQVAGLFGGVDGIVGWIGDVAVVVNGAEGGIEGGLLVQPTDATAAQNLFLTVRSMLTLGGASLGVSVSDEQHGEATITTVDFGDIGTLLEMGGEDPELIEIFGGSLTGRVQLSWTVTDDLVVIGIGPEFVRHVLDTEPAESLAENERFASLLDRVGQENAGLWFADVTAMRALLEQAALRRAEVAGRYDGEIKPFLEPFDAVIGAMVLGGSDPDSARSLITVK